jgi:hypothetical protein
LVCYRRFHGGNACHCETLIELFLYIAKRDLSTGRGQAPDLCWTTLKVWPISLSSSTPFAMRGWIEKYIPNGFEDSVSRRNCPIFHTLDVLVRGPSQLRRRKRDYQRRLTSQIPVTGSKLAYLSEPHDQQGARSISSVRWRSALRSRHGSLLLSRQIHTNYVSTCLRCLHSTPPSFCSRLVSRSNQTPVTCSTV